MTYPVDHDQRLAALDPLRSVCVTAPAGSGKTELLSQRVLKLLATADYPEDILAITFTRKAAAEMHHRIIQALADAESDQQPEQAHKLLSWTLAREALARDADRGWHLLDNTGRLKIQTIDSLCASLTRQMPILSNFGAQPQIAQNAEPYYQLAVRQLFDLLEQPTALADDLAVLLLHVDNDMARAERLLVMLLQRRDQWLFHIGMAGDPQRAKQTLEHTLQQLILDLLQQLHSELAAIAPDLLPLIDYAACNMHWQNIDSRVSQLAGIMELPPVSVDAAEQWLAIAELMLTASHQWRKTVNKNSGFPTETEDGDKALAKQLKGRFIELLGGLQENENLLQLLVQLRHLPAAHYEPQQWQLLESLTRLLPRLVAQLTLVFQQHGEVDYSQISMAALQALGEGMNPTELAMKMDHQLRHILVDEFQDTATTQFNLLERLMEGWAEHNSANPQRPNTLFIVGDGMQSIYGFREANVSLFLQARKHGVNGVLLDDLPLKVNFRSDPGVVNWVNDTFEQAFPAQENLARGAVPYEAAMAFNATKAQCEVAIMGFTGEQSRLQEAERVVSLVQQTQQQDSSASIAILVRSRGHLRDIIPALSAAGLRWSATDIDPLSSYAAIIDLLSLTKALLNSADRISWLALLRTPWIGLNNDDLHRLLVANERRSVRSLLSDEALVKTLSSHARQRIPQVAAVLSAAIHNQCRYSLRSWLEGVWLALGGAATIHHDDEFTAVDDYFDLLESHQQGDSLASLPLFERAVEQLYAAPAVTDSKLSIMTIHKAKGLEFDAVILPALARPLRSDDKALLMWREYLSPGDNSRGLVISPLGATGNDEDSVYNWLRFEQSQTTSLENTRLFYVAATRAVSKLYILLTSELDKKTAEPKPPASNSLLSSAWPALQAAVVWSQPKNSEVEQIGFNFEAPSTLVAMNRLVGNWQPPAWSFKNPLESFYISADTEQADNIPELLQDQLPACVGTVVHWILEALVAKGVDHWLTMPAVDRSRWLQSLLHFHNLPNGGWPLAIEMIEKAVQNTLSDSKGLWILSNKHQQSTTELSVLSTINDRYKHKVIDRVFIDKSQGICWIVDYKTSTPQANESREDFISREVELYRYQLMDYKFHLSLLFPQALPIRTALYFTHYPHWQELEL
jgi:ATP-dependent exoDNAse (exonuclease V) beta subunit